jgi:hypothetical protein
VKIYMAYDVNPRLLMKRLKGANQPVIRIRFYGPATTKVGVVCIGFEDSANNSVVSGIISEISGKNPTPQGSADQENKLKKEFEPMREKFGPIQEGVQSVPPPKPKSWLRFLGIKGRA